MIVNSTNKSLLLCQSIYGKVISNILVISLYCHINVFAFNSRYADISSPVYTYNIHIVVGINLIFTERNEWSKEVRKAKATFPCACF
jgi:hypothetical protein